MRDHAPAAPQPERPERPERPEPTLQYFDYEHLPPLLQAISQPFHHLAHSLIRRLPQNPERSVALRKLLEAKDAAVRASIFKDPEQPAT